MLKRCTKNAIAMLLLAGILLMLLPPMQVHAATTHSHPLCGTSCSCSSSHANETWQVWDGTSRMYSNYGHYYLEEDIVLDSTVILDYSYTTYLCLNGHTITCEDTVFDIYSYRSLLITDCKGTGKIETTGNSCTISNNKYLSIWGGTILNSSSFGSAIDAFRGTTTYVCKGRVESENYAAIDAYPGCSIHIQGGTVHSNNHYAIESAGSDDYTSRLTISGGTISSDDSYSGIIHWIDGNFTMSGGYVDGDVDVTEGDSITKVSGGTINGALAANGKTVSITGGEMELVSWADTTTVSAGTFHGTSQITGTEATISVGNFSDCDYLLLGAPTWIYGGSFSLLKAGDYPLYLSGLPSIEMLEITKPNLVSAQNKDNSGSYAGDPIPVKLSGTWNDGAVVVQNVTSDALAQKFVLTGDDTAWKYLERSSNNLVLRVLPGGSCGSNATWCLKDGVLTISGTGAIAYNHSGREYPWGDYCNEITRIVVEPGITAIPDYAFEYCENCTSISLPNTITSLSLSAFNDCGSLNNLLLPAGAVIDPYRNEFIRCESLQDLYFMGTEEEWAEKTSVTPVTSINSNMTVHCLQYYPGTANCVSGGTEGYYRFENSTVYTGLYNEDKEPITQPATVPAYGHRVITQQTATVDPISINNSSSVPFLLSGGIYYSQNHDHNSASEVLIVAEHPCTVTMRYGVSSERNYDKLSVYNNGSLVAEISGTTNNQTKTFYMSAADSITVRYSKDSSASSGNDDGWFSLAYDQVETTVDVVVPADTQDADCINAVVCDYCQETIKPALGHRIVEERVTEVAPITVENTSSTPFTVEDGTYYSNNHGSSSTSELKFRAEYPCSLVLNYGVSSENNYDFLKILHNSTQKASISGSISGRSLTLTLAQGDIVTVRYSKDSSVSNGQDRGWVTPEYEMISVNASVDVPIDTANISCTETVSCHYCGEDFQGNGSHSFVDGSCEGCGLLGGYCGDKTVNNGMDVSWTLIDGILTISGSGDMADYASENDVPWKSHQGEITSAVIEAGVTGIGDYAFYGCGNMTGIVIGSDVARIGNSAFYSCDGLTEVTIPDSVTEIKPAAFAGCTDLTAIQVGEGNPSYTSDSDGILFNKEKTVLVQVPGSCSESYTIPDSVTEIGEHAFDGCDKLTEVTVGENVTSIGEGAFANCTSLADVYYDDIQSAWEQITMGSDNECLTDANIHFVDPCAEGHEWADADCETPKTCTVCGATDGEPLEHVDEDKDHICDRGCGKEDVEEHKDSAEDDDHICDYCGSEEILENCSDKDGDEDHVCDICGAEEVSEHIWVDADCETPKTCSECGATDGEPLEHVDEDKDHICDRGCGKEDIEEHKDSAEDEDHICDYCGNDEILENCSDIDGDEDHACDICGAEEVSEHIWVDADCETPKTCTECGTTDGDVLPHDVQKYRYQSSGNVISATCGDCGAEMGSYTLSASGGNYDSVTVFKAAVEGSITGVPAPEIQYDCEENCRNAGNHSAYISLGGVTAECDFRIEPAALRISFVDSENRVYDATDLVSVTGIKLDGICEEDDVSVDLSGLNARVASTDVGTYETVTISDVAIIGADASNYSIMVMSEIALDKPITISKRPLTLKAADQSVALGQTVGSGVEYVNTDEGTCVAGNDAVNKIEISGDTSKITQSGVLTIESVDIVAALDSDMRNVNHNYEITVMPGVLKVFCPGHVVVVKPAVDPTCNETGLTEGSFCSVCDEEIKAQEIVPAKGHTAAVDAAVEATCTVEGKTEGSHCSACGAVLKVQETIPALGHTPVIDPAVAPTEDQPGKTEGSHCSVCSAVIRPQEEIPALGHTHIPATDPAVAPTCTAPGKTEGSHCSACNEVIQAQETIPALGHTPVIDPAVAPTEDQPGKTEGSHCSVCSAVIQPQEEIPALGHTHIPVTDPAVAPTCTAPGKTEGSHCSSCGAILTPQQQIDPAHTYSHKYDYKCDICGETRDVDMTRAMVDMFRMYNPNTGEHFYTGSTEERDNLIAVGWQYEGVGFTFPLATGDPVYRLFEPVTGEHLYTMDVNEKDALLAAGWNYENIAFNSGFENEVPQYRLHNPNASVGAYHFTASAEERDTLINAGWEYQGIGWYSLGSMN